MIGRAAGGRSVQLADDDGAVDVAIDEVDQHFAAGTWREDGAPFGRGHITAVRSPALIAMSGCGLTSRQHLARSSNRYDGVRVA